MVEFLDNQNRRVLRLSRSFPRFSVGFFGTPVELDGDKVGLATAVQHRAELGTPLQIIRLATPCRITRGCLAKINAVSPFCGVVSEKQYITHRNGDPSWYTAPSYRIFEDSYE
jgi:hypothetical protein